MPPENRALLNPSAAGSGHIVLVQFLQKRRPHLPRVFSHHGKSQCNRRQNQPVKALARRHHRHHAQLHAKHIQEEQTHPEIRQRHPEERQPPHNIIDDASFMDCCENPQGDGYQQHQNQGSKRQLQRRSKPCKQKLRHRSVHVRRLQIPT